MMYARTRQKLERIKAIIAGVFIILFGALVAWFIVYDWIRFYGL